MAKIELNPRDLYISKDRKEAVDRVWISRWVSMNSSFVKECREAGVEDVIFENEDLIEAKDS